MAYPYCCGPYWDTLLLSSTSTGTIATDPTNSSNHVFKSNVGPNNGSDYADWSILTQNSATAHGYNGSEVWVRFRMYFPLDFKPTGYTAGQVNSEFNWLHEFHDSAGWSSKCPSEDAGHISLGILNASYANPPHFRLHLIGGQQTSTNCNPNETRIEGPVVQLGHWYDVIEHVRFSPTAAQGLIQLWIDGQQMASLNFPTLFIHPDGTVSNDYIQFGYYRMKASWTANVQYDNVREGPTLSSVS